MMNLQPSHRGSSYKLKFILEALFFLMDFIVCDFQIRPGTIFRSQRWCHFYENSLFPKLKPGDHLPLFFLSPLTSAHTFDEDRKADYFGRNHIIVKIA